MQAHPDLCERRARNTGFSVALLTAIPAVEEVSALRPEPIWLSRLTSNCLRCGGFPPPFKCLGVEASDDSDWCVRSRLCRGSRSLLSSGLACDASRSDAGAAWRLRHKKRPLAVSIAGVLAKARERGVEPEHEKLVEKAMRLVNENAKMNTEFHYAYEFVDILRTSAIEPSYSMVEGAVSHLAGGLVPGGRSADKHEFWWNERKPDQPSRASLFGPHRDTERCLHPLQLRPVHHRRRYRSVCSPGS